MRPTRHLLSPLRVVRWPRRGPRESSPSIVDAAAGAGTTTGLPIHITITRRQSGRGTQLCVRVVGDVDLVTASALADALDGARHGLLKSPAPVEMVVDLREVEFLSASGIRVLMDAYDSCHENAIVLCVAADHSAVTRPLLLTGLNARLGLRPSPDGPPET